MLEIIYHNFYLPYEYSSTIVGQVKVARLDFLGGGDTSQV